jgi:hypothetical protein
MQFLLLRVGRTCTVQYQLLTEKEFACKNNEVTCELRINYCGIGQLGEMESARRYSTDAKYVAILRCILTSCNAVATKDHVLNNVIFNVLTGKPITYFNFLIGLTSLLLSWLFGTIMLCRISYSC